MSADNFRFVQRVPFGKRLVNGRLVDDRRELKAARLIVELRKRKNLPWKDIVAKVKLAGYRTKKGLPWKVGTVRAEAMTALVKEATELRTILAKAVATARGQARSGSAPAAG